MQKAWLSALAVAAALAAAPAYAAIVVVGNGWAQGCYSAAAANRDDLNALRACNMAIAEQSLNERNRAATYVNRGIIQLNRNNADEALADFDRAVELMPSMADVHVNRAAALLYLRHYDEARAAADQAIALNPEEPHKAYFIRAAANEELGNLSAAYHDYQRSAELAPEWSVARAELARFRVRS